MLAAEYTPAKLISSLSLYSGIASSLLPIFKCTLPRLPVRMIVEM